MINALYSRETLRKQPEEFRIGAVISDGMWYSLPKWRKIAKVSEEVITAWIDRHLEDGTLIQSPCGAKSYRFPLESIEAWYEENNLPLGVQLLDFMFPPRIWDGMTEVEGFIKAPLREIGVVTFLCSSKVAAQVTERLRGVARVRQEDPGHYKCYCLDANYAKKIVESVFAENKAAEIEKMYARSISRRRELVDFTPVFRRDLVMFYKSYGRSLARGSQETISIFLPEREDQEGQMIMWVIAAAEKLNQAKPVPFSGYLQSVLSRWPYNLPKEHLGDELSDFQRGRARALKELRKEHDDPSAEFSSREIAEKMGVSMTDFVTLEASHKVWLASRSATTLTWAESNEEKSGENVVLGLGGAAAVPSDIELSHRLSMAAVKVGLETGLYEDAFTLMSQIDASDINMSAVEQISEEFIAALGVEMGVGQGR